VTERNEAEAQLYDQTCQLLKIHTSLLGDGNRNRAFYKALEESIDNESRVLDIGSGTGIWAIVAAKLGARRVVAIEQEALLIGLTRALVRDNGVADRVEIIQGNAGQVELDRDFDVVISETIGHLIFDEQIVQIMIDARQRFLRPNGVLIPNAVALVVAPAHLEREPENLPVAIDANYGYFESLLLNVPVGLTGKTHLEMLGEARDLLRLDLSSVESGPDLTSLKAVWPNQEMKSVSGFAVWAEANLSRNVEVATIDTTSWSTMFYPVKQFQAEAGKLEFDLMLTSNTNYWTATLSADEKRELQSYSPAFASTELLAQTRTSPETVNHLKAMGLIGGQVRIAANTD
jgi:SAM-dependent methyltransferase